MAKTKKKDPLADIPEAFKKINDEGLEAKAIQMVHSLSNGEFVVIYDVEGGEDEKFKIITPFKDQSDSNSEYYCSYWRDSIEVCKEELFDETFWLEPVTNLPNNILIYDTFIPPQEKPEVGKTGIIKPNFFEETRKIKTDLQGVKHNKKAEEIIGLEVEIIDVVDHHPICELPDDLDYKKIRGEHILIPRGAFSVLASPQTITPKPREKKLSDKERENLIQFIDKMEEMSGLLPKELQEAFKELVDNKEKLDGLTKLSEELEVEAEKEEDKKSPGGFTFKMSL